MLKNILLWITITCLCYATASFAENQTSAIAADVVVETGTEDAVTIQSQHQGEIQSTVNGEPVSPKSNDFTDDSGDETRDDLPSSDIAKDEFF
jgi:hypothetical protein